MKTEELLSILGEFHREKLALRQRHVAVARLVGDYEFNNTYQYIIAREDVHLQWLEAAIIELAGTPDDVAEPTLPSIARGESVRPLIALDAPEIGGFVNRWRARLGEVTHARHRNMMQVILGEMLEHKRFFDQMNAGQDDLLGRRANGPGSPGTGDGVMGVRWVG